MKGCGRLLALLFVGVLLLDASLAATRKENAKKPLQTYKSAKLPAQQPAKRVERPAPAPAAPALVPPAPPKAKFQADQPVQVQETVLWVDLGSEFNVEGSLQVLRLLESGLRVLVLCNKGSQTQRFFWRVLAPTFSPANGTGKEPQSQRMFLHVVKPEASLLVQLGFVVQQVGGVAQVLFAAVERDLLAIFPVLERSKVTTQWQQSLMDLLRPQIRLLTAALLPSHTAEVQAPYGVISNLFRHQDRSVDVAVPSVVYLTRATSPLAQNQRPLAVQNGLFPSSAIAEQFANATLLRRPLRLHNNNNNNNDDDDAARLPLDPVSYSSAEGRAALRSTVEGLLAIRHENNPLLLWDVVLVASKGRLLCVGVFQALAARAAHGPIDVGQAMSSPLLEELAAQYVSATNYHGAATLRFELHDTVNTPRHRFLRFTEIGLDPSPPLAHDRLLTWPCWNTVAAHAAGLDPLLPARPPSGVRYRVAPYTAASAASAVLFPVPAAGPVLPIIDLVPTHNSHLLAFLRSRFDGDQLIPEQRSLWLLDSVGAAKNTSRLHSNSRWLPLF